MARSLSARHRQFKSIKIRICGVALNQVQSRSATRPRHLPRAYRGLIVTPLERVIVIGNTGSGKSTLAEALARRLGLTFIELDALFWLPDWREPKPEAFRDKVRAAIEGGRWVIAGNYNGRTQDITWPEAQVVVRLDLGLPLSLLRVTRRSWRRSRSGELLWGTNTETFRKHLKLWSDDSLLKWAVKSQSTHRTRARAERLDPRWAHIDFVRLRSPGEVARWLAAMAPVGAASRPDQSGREAATADGAARIEDR
jgi:adenylate kinase family enzyme